jgi:hypothetical protein
MLCQTFWCFFQSGALLSGAGGRGYSPSSQAGVMPRVGLSYNDGLAKDGTSTGFFDFFQIKKNGHGGDGRAGSVAWAGSH